MLSNLLTIKRLINLQNQNKNSGFFYVMVMVVLFLKMRAVAK